MKGQKENLEFADIKVNAIIDYPANFDKNKSTEVIFFATPNGANAESSYGPQANLKKQIEQLRSNSAQYSNKNLILIIASPYNGIWENYNKQFPNQTVGIFDRLVQRVKGKYSITGDLSVSLDSHSGGGEFIMDYINKNSEIPSFIHSIDFFDSLYWYNGASHAQKIKKWLESNPANRFTLTTGTPDIRRRQHQLISDLTNLGISFEERSGVGSEENKYTERKAMNGQIVIRDMERFDHNGTIAKNGLASIKDPAGIEFRSI